MPRVKCSILDRNKEKIFSRIATRGVVKFFNVCNQEQKEIESKLVNESTERKRDKILSSIDKSSFLDRLKENNLLDDESNTKKSQIEADEPTWSVLRDNFIMGSKIKDWDKEEEEEQEKNEDNSFDDDDQDDNDIPKSKPKQKSAGSLKKHNKQKNKKAKRIGK